MARKEKRYVAKMEMYIYAENDYMARRRAHELRKAIDENVGNTRASVEELGEQPFASLEYRKLKDQSEPISKKREDELPF